MATGKTTVGRALARTLGWPFVDTDALVEASDGRSIAQIFAHDGERAFREMERTAIGTACEMGDAVIAVGGGALLDVENRRRLAAAGPVICLKADPEEILRRVGAAETRPLLKDGEREVSSEERLERIRSMMSARDAAYAVATHTVDTTGLSVEEVASRVRDLVERR